MSYNRDSDDALSKPLRVYAERDKIKRFDAQGNANVVGAYCFYADAEGYIAELEANLLESDHQHNRLCNEILSLKHELKTAKRDAILEAAFTVPVRGKSVNEFVADLVNYANSICKER